MKSKAVFRPGGGQRADLPVPVTGSTNIDAKTAAEEGAPEGTLVVTEQQEAGRGRRGRGWFSPEGCNLYFTLLLRPECAPDQACMLTLVMALAVAGAVRSWGLMPESNGRTTW